MFKTQHRSIKTSRVPARGAGLAFLVAAGVWSLGCSSGFEVDEAEEIETVALPASVRGLCGGERCDAVARGLTAFFDRKLHGLGGHGRACADCHIPGTGFQLSPESVEERFQLLQARKRRNRNADDPLFRAIDADDFRTNGNRASDFGNLRRNGLVRITFPLPANLHLIDPATGEPSNETFVDVWRSVPSVNNVKLTGPDGLSPFWERGPNPAGGYQLDARLATLQEQALGALVNHAEVGKAPSPRLLDDLTAFQRVLFSSSGVQKLSDAISAGASSLPDSDPPLSALAQQGKLVFQRACATCHGGASSTRPSDIANVRYHDIASQCPRPVDSESPARFAFAPCPPRLARNERTYELSLPDGTKLRRVSSDPGRALLTGSAGAEPPPLDDWNKFDVAPLHGIKNTPPYFHNNSAATLDEVLDHYDAFFKFVEAGVPPDFLPGILTTDFVNVDRPFKPEERPALLAYLRTF